MLIGIDASRTAVTERTGTENYSLNLTRHLLMLETSHRFRLYFNWQPDPALFPARPQLDLWYIPFPRLWTHLRLSREMALNPPDVLFVPAHVIPLIHPRRNVVTIHDLGYLYYPRAHRAWDRRYLDWSTRWNARVAAHLIADSQATKEDLTECYRVDPERVTVAYPAGHEGLAPVVDKEVINETKSRYGISGDYVLYVGTLHPRKNLVRLVEAFQRMEKRGEVKLAIAGKKGWLYDDVFRRVEELGLQVDVIFPGYVPEDDLPALLSGARLFTLASLHEGFGLSVLEAMACGTPTLCSNVTSLPEVAGDAALLVDPLDVDDIAAAMDRGVDDEQLRAELVAKGFEQVKRFSWERCARQVMAVIEQVSKLGTVPTSY